MPQKTLKGISQRNIYDQIGIQTNIKKNGYVNKEINQLIKNKSFAIVESKLGYQSKMLDPVMRLFKSQMVIVVLILLIAGLNIYNTIKTNLLIRLSEFSTLRAIGMTIMQLRNMIISESIIYGLLSSIIAGLIGSYENYRFFRLMNKQYNEAYHISNVAQFKIPFLAIVLYMIISIFVCLLAAYASKGKIEKLNIIDGLKSNE